MRGYFHRFIKSIWLHHCKTYGFDRRAQKLIYDYLSDRLQKTPSFSDYLDIIYGVPQGSIPASLLFNIELYNLRIIVLTLQTLLMMPLLTNMDLHNKVMNNFKIMFAWISFNNSKANASKCHLFITPYQPIPVNVRGSITEYSSCEKLLGIYTDKNFHPNIL